MPGCRPDGVTDAEWAAAQASVLALLAWAYGIDIENFTRETP